eukprot:4823787-Alexandrium_andersonii.AAC.2
MPTLATTARHSHGLAADNSGSLKGSLRKGPRHDRRRKSPQIASNRGKPRQTAACRHKLPQAAAH